MLSFDITDRNIRIIKGVENKNKISISSAASINVDEDIIVNGHVKDVPRLATLINQRIKQNRMMDKEAIVSISSNMTIFKELSVRKTSKDADFVKNVKAEMQSKVGIDDSYLISYSIVEGSATAQENNDMATVLATACPTEVVDSYKRVFSMLGIPLKSVIIGCNCITKVILSDEKNTSKMPLLAVQIDNNFISLNIYENNQLSFSRFASIDPADYSNSEDYVYEAVNENIFRMIQFNRSRGTSEPIQKVLLYGDTKDFMRISKDLEQMEIITEVITPPRIVKGYQNFEFALYANAIGAMFSRNKASEKINLLEFGGAASFVSDRVNSDHTFIPLFIGTVAVTLIVMGGITAVLKIQDNGIVKETKRMQAYIDDPATQAQLQLRLDRIDMRDKVKNYKDMASLGYDALKSQPYIESEVYKKIEETLKKTITDVGNKNIVYELDDVKNWEPINVNALSSTVNITDFSYSKGAVTFTYTTYAGDEAAPVFNERFIENLIATNYFISVENNGYTLQPEGEMTKYGATLSAPTATTPTPTTPTTPAEGEEGEETEAVVATPQISIQENGKEKVRSFTATITMKLKSPVDYKDMTVYGGTETEGEE